MLVKDDIPVQRATGLAPESSYPLPGAGTALLTQETGHEHFGPSSMEMV